MDIIRIRPLHRTSLGWITEAYGTTEFPTVDLDWFIQHPERIASRLPFSYAGFSVSGYHIIPTDVWPIGAETTIIFGATLTQIQRLIAPPFAVPTSFTYSAALWPFFSLINPDDYAPNVQFILEVVMDTSNVIFPVRARLYNLTNTVAVAGSDAVSSALHLDTSAWVRSGLFSLVSGIKEYQVQYGGETGSGATVHLHSAKLLVVYT